MSSANEHPLIGWQLKGNSFDVDIEVTVKRLEEILGISSNRLDLTFESLDEVSSCIRSFQFRSFDLETFLPLLEYFGEVIRISLKGSWLLKKNVDFEIFEPWIQIEDSSTGIKTAVPVHFHLTKQLQNVDGCDLRKTAEGIKNILIEAHTPQPRKTLGLRSRYEDDTFVIFKRGFLQANDLVTPEVKAVAHQWIRETVNYFSGFGFFQNLESTSHNELVKAFEDRFDSINSLNDFYLEFLDVNSPNMEPIDSTRDKTKFLALYLLRLDLTRVWSNLEVPKILVEESTVFRTLKGLSRISRGLLDIENFEGDSIQIRLGNSIHRMTIDDFDSSIESLLNQLLRMERLDYQFCLYDESLPNEKVVILFSELERQRLRRDKMFYA